MNQIERLREQVSERFPTAQISIDAPGQPSGSWWLDVKLNDHVLVVEWRSGNGFGISTVSKDAYGMGPDETYPDVDAAYERVKALLLGQVRTVAAPEPVTASPLDVPGIDLGVTAEEIGPFVRESRRVFE